MFTAEMFTAEMLPSILQIDVVVHVQTLQSLEGARDLDTRRAAIPKHE
jgi:hypothetical protein